uniref:Cytochrome P450 n=1 Tax=Caenorhabditis japonica TaxID=281687 RepID=A0A8R1HXS9_CAEJA
MSILILTVTVTAILSVLSYYLWIWSYWMRRGVKGPRGLPFVGVLDQLLVHETPGMLKLGEWTKKYGPVYGITDGTHRTLVIADPDMVHEIFVKQFDNFYGRKLNPIQGDPETDQRVHLLAAQGHRWKRLRTISAPTFSNGNLRKLKSTVEDCSLELLRHIENKTADGQQIDMLSFYQEFTMDVIGRIAMGQTDSQMFRNPILDVVRDIFCGNHNNLMLICQVFPAIGSAVRQLTFKYPDKIPAFKLYSLMEQTVTTRMRHRNEDLKKGIELDEPHDFIDLFLNAKTDEEFENEANEEFTKRNMKVTKQLTAEEVVGQCFLFLIAGFDTTALSLSYATYLLATNPRVQQKLHEEVDRECPDPEIEFEQLNKLKYMECVLKETLRLYPLASISNSRKCLRSTTVNGVKIEEGTHVQLDTWSLHYDPKIWGDDVEEFKPERWENTEDYNEHKGYYLPFGMGPRQCIGMRLAYMEQKLLLAHILRKYRLETGTKTAIPLKLVGSATTSPKDVFLHLIPRHD